MTHKDAPTDKQVLDERASTWCTGTQKPVARQAPGRIITKLLRALAGGGPLMDSDEVFTIDDPEDAAWVARQLEVVVAYLAQQHVQHGGVSQEPRWFLSPYVAVWAIRSQANPDRVGWWAISGDLPTDYMTCRHERDPGDVLIAFAKQWKVAAERMAVGEQLDNYRIGDSARAAELAPLLAARAEVLDEFAKRIKHREL
jgi:hypothetical protein